MLRFSTLKILETDKIAKNRLKTRFFHEVSQKPDTEVANHGIPKIVTGYGLIDMY